MGNFHFLHISVIKHSFPISLYLQLSKHDDDYFEKTNPALPLSWHLEAYNLVNG